MGEEDRGEAEGRQRGEKQQGNVNTSIFWRYMKDRLVAMLEVTAFVDSNKLISNFDLNVSSELRLISLMMQLIDFPLI